MTVFVPTPTDAQLLDDTLKLKRGFGTRVFEFFRRQPVGSIGMALVLIFGLAGIFAQLDYRDWENRVRELKAILNEPGEVTSPEELRALQLELRRLGVQRPDTKKKSAS